MYAIVTPQQLLRQARNFFTRHPELKAPFVTLIEDLQRDPLQPHLELHQLSGRLKGCHAVSLSYGYRITLTLMLSDKEIILLDIGSHDEVYR